MLDELQQRAQEAVNLATGAGAQDAWAVASRGRSVEVSYRDGALEKVQESTSRALNLRLYVDGRYSTHSTTDLRVDRLSGFVDEAVALTRALEQDPERLITDPSLFEGRSDKDLQLVDKELAAITPDDRLKWCQEMDATARTHEKVISATSGVYDGHNLVAAASSNGFSGSAESTSLWMGSEVTIQGAGDRRPEDWYWAGGRHRADVPDTASLGSRCLAQVLERLGSEKGPTERSVMVVTPRATAQLVRRLLGAANARSVQQGRSFYAGKIGEKMFSDVLTVTDDPLLVRGLGSRHFDDEGIASKPLTLVENGVLKNIYVDTYYGRKAGLTPTTGGTTNRVVALGDKDLNQLLSEVDRGVYVTSWLGGNADGTTGDFSLGLRGHVVKGGEVGAPIGEMNVTGNLIDLFTRLVAVGNDPWVYSTLRCPTLVFDDVQFSGA